MNQIASKHVPTVVNGIDVDKITGLAGTLQQDAGKGGWQFRARNRWIGGGVNRTEIQDFAALGGEDTSRQAPFVVENDEPFVLAGEDTVPNPVEYYLHALAGCVTTSVAAHAAVRGIHVGAISTTLEGDIDIRGFLGVAEDVRKGYNTIRVRMRVETDAAPEVIRELAGFSPVFEMVSRAVPTELTVDVE